VETVFTEIYHAGTWKELAPAEESHSGAGSTVQATARVRAFLPKALAQLGAEVLLDAPCGDFNWMRHVELDVDYVGADVVRELVEENTRQYAGTRRRFVHCDLLEDELPKADVILCRDCLTHFSPEDVWRAIENFRDSEATWLLTSTYTSRTVNRPIETGKWTPYCLELPPFNFPPPAQLLNEDCRELYPFFSDKCLGLWRINDLP
jgi:hypothetical protein